NYSNVLKATVSNTYRSVTVDPWYSGAVPPTQSHRMYFGATYDQPVAEMFSFFPCKPYDPNGCGFARPEIKIPGLINGQLKQGKKIASDVGVATLNKLWNAVVAQVKEHALMLGVYVELPRELQMAARYPEAPAARDRC